MTSGTTTMAPPPISTGNPFTTASTSTTGTTAPPPMEEGEEAETGPLPGEVECGLVCELEVDCGAIEPDEAETCVFECIDLHDFFDDTCDAAFDGLNACLAGLTCAEYFGWADGTAMPLPCEDETAAFEPCVN